MAAPRREYSSRTRRKDPAPAPPSPPWGSSSHTLSLPRLSQLSSRPRTRGPGVPGNSTREEVAFPRSLLTPSPAQTAPRKIQAAGSISQEERGPRVRSHRTTRRQGASPLGPLQPLDLGPFESRCSEPQPPAGFCAGLSVESTFPSLPRTTAPEGIWEGRVPWTLLRLRAS